MIRFLADENLDHDIVRGLSRRVPDVDVVTVQAAGLRGADDEAVLAFAADHERVVITQDFATFIGLAHARVRTGKPMAGVIAVAQGRPIGETLDELELIAECSAIEDWLGQVRYIPLR